MTDGLRLKAEDSDDLSVIAACLQDALCDRAGNRYYPGYARHQL
jgi:hypothetical protein